MDNQQQANPGGVVTGNQPPYQVIKHDDASAASAPPQQPHDTPPTRMSVNVGQRPTQIRILSDDNGQRRTEEVESVGHDPDLPEPNERHTLSTYEAARMFEEAECRVSERTVIRWCNKNKRGHRRLDCSFDPNERKYYIAEDSVKGVIREERSKGRQTEMFNPDVSDIEEMSDATARQEGAHDGQRPTRTTDPVGQMTSSSDMPHPEQSKPVGQDRTQEREDRVTLAEENMNLKIELAKLEEQARTKDEMMTFLRKEIDRRGEQITDDRETYSNSLEWFKAQVTAKDAVIERLNSEMRGLLEAPKQPEQTSLEGPAGERVSGVTTRETPQETPVD